MSITPGLPATADVQQEVKDAFDDAGITTDNISDPKYGEIANEILGDLRDKYNSRDTYTDNFSENDPAVDSEENGCSNCGESGSNGATGTGGVNGANNGIGDGPGGRDQAV